MLLVPNRQVSYGAPYRSQGRQEVAQLIAPTTPTIQLSDNSETVGLAGFEPAASCSQSKRANQAALQPVAIVIVADMPPTL